MRLKEKRNGQRKEIYNNIKCNGLKDKYIDQTEHMIILYHCELDKYRCPFNT